jgi:outer membrane lipoprotein-sorting protein
MADPVLLLYRADWTQWSLSVKVIRRRNWRLYAELTGRLAADMRRRSGGMINFMGSALSVSRQARDDGGSDGWAQTTERLLIAPGGRYRFAPEQSRRADDRVRGRVDDDDDDDQVRLIVSDGEFCWVIWAADAERSVADLAHPPFSDIVRPTWLMHQLRLSATGTSEVAGRAALQVRGTPRLPADRWAWITAQLDRVDIVIDAELGLVLRYESVFDGQPLSCIEVADLVINPGAAADAASFRPDDAIEVELGNIGPAESHRYWRGGDFEPDPQIDKGRMALNLARGAVYLAARQLARPEPTPAEPSQAVHQDADAEMPATAPPAPGPAPATPGSRRPVSDGVLHLVTRTGMPPLTLTAQVHHWLDTGLAIRSVPVLGAGNMHEVPGASGFLGWEDDAFFSRDGSHRTARLTVAEPDRYRIDFEREDRPRHPLTMACDGERLYKIYRNRVVDSPPLPLPADFVRIVDPAWLLSDWPLSEVGEQRVEGRRAIRLIAERPPMRADRRSRASEHNALIDLLIDAELGIALRQVSYLDGRPVSRYELRDVQSREAVDVAEFGAGIAPGLPVIQTNGEPIGDLDLPDSARAVGQVGAELFNGARSAFGWLAGQARKGSGG